MTMLFIEYKVTGHANVQISGFYNEINRSYAFYNDRVRIGYRQNFSPVYNWLQKVANIVYKFTAITGRKNVRHFDALIFFQGVK